MSAALPSLFVTALFAAAGAWYLVQALRADRLLADRVSDGLHVLLAAALIAFAWLGPALAGAGLLVFTAAAFWFLFAALFPRGSDAGAPRERLAVWYPVALMGSAAVIGLLVPAAAAKAEPDATESVQLSYAIPLQPVQGALTAAIGAAPALLLGGLFAGTAVLLFLLVAQGARTEGEEARPTSRLNAAAVTAVGMSYAFFVLVPRSS